ncbi:MAG: HU family DNA-binding protein [Deltaproteobacteria bacterium]|jgi:nucleoid DNA-binding protein|nr:HU family DNA-binding protein [Deltaproteobacteria bacterium]
MADEPLSKSALLNLLVARNDKLPQQVSRLAGELLLDKITESLCHGRAVSLRGFGRFIPRFYKSTPSKKLGLLFHPSPRLVDRVNSPKKRPDG